MTAYDDDLRLAHVLADAVERVTMARFRAEDLVVESKPDLTPVTDADRAAEEHIRAQLKRTRPRDAVQGEEFGSTGHGPRRWIIDPIDGTKSFVRHVPIWGTLLGLEYEGEQIAGVVYIPVFRQMYRALRGDGAYLDDIRIRVSDTPTLAESILCYSSIGWFTRAGRQETFLKLYGQTGRQRGYGDFFGFVLVAQGSADLMVEHGVSPWDVAATKVLVEEAGGTFTDWDGTPTIHRPDVLASNGKLHAKALALLRE